MRTGLSAIVFAIVFSEIAAFSPPIATCQSSSTTAYRHSDISPSVRPFCSRTLNPSARRRGASTTSTQLYGLRSFFRRLLVSSSKEKDQQQEKTNPVEVIVPEPPEPEPFPKSFRRYREEEDAVSVCVIGGGVSGLLAAQTAAKNIPKEERVVLLEGSPTLGGRVQSDVTEDGYVLDRGFAVFIKEYPMAQQVLDYDSLQLKEFLPGALVKLKGRTMARVSDPLRQVDIPSLTESTFQALVAPVGSLEDKLRLLPLFAHVIFRDIDDLFREKETDTLTCLKERWGFSDDMIEKFFSPFLEGIYLVPLSQQSSRMFHFVLKMFSQGAAALPQGGIGEVAGQLQEKATESGVELRTGATVTRIDAADSDGMLKVYFANLETKKKGLTKLRAKSVILATDGHITQKIMSTVDGFESLESLEENPQRAVGCLYYGFSTPVPVTDPILILSGLGQDRGTEANPINNVCFPSVVNEGYAPEGCNLCSVTILKPAMEVYKGREKELDEAVRKQLQSWFPTASTDIQNMWELKGIYSIPNAQPAQFGGPNPANVNGGRECTQYRGKKLPEGLTVCGDHMATATLNGALESGFNAGMVAAKVAKQNKGVGVQYRPTVLVQAGSATSTR